MTEMEPREAGIDSLLRRSMAAPVPSLPPDFDQRLMREVRRSSQPLDRYRRILLDGYGLVSVVASAVVMRGQGLDWGRDSGDDTGATRRGCSRTLDAACNPVGDVGPGSQVDGRNRGDIG